MVYAHGGDQITSRLPELPVEVGPHSLWAAIWAHVLFKGGGGGGGGGSREEGHIGLSYDDIDTRVRMLSLAVSALVLSIPVG